MCAMGNTWYDYYATETKDYRMGTLTIYSGSKKHNKPKYGFKFVNTDKKRKKRK